eukprot:TRINITY_DN76334_c0_g1_i1.p1 TRINITY_DN76334_c0_g1~~TRINITY_DN76334_c0_g1_i1.p1  ORF type:complete len:330 (-),score=23.39 TRINITY_DN76334_c0_g1_i1:25-942(-)
MTAAEPSYTSREIPLARICFVALIRSVSVNIVMLPACALVPREYWPQRADFCRFLVCGLSLCCGVFLVFFAEHEDISWFTLNMSLLNPVFAILIAHFCRIEHVPAVRRFWVMVCCIGGVVTWTSATGFEGDTWQNWFIITSLAQCFFSANYFVQLYPLIRMGYAPVIIASVVWACVSIVSLFTCLPYLVYLVATGHGEDVFVDWNVMTKFYLVFITVFTGALGHCMAIWATGKLGPTLPCLVGGAVGVPIYMAVCHVEGKFAIQQALLGCGVILGGFILFTHHGWNNEVSSANLSVAFAEIPTRH